MDDATKLRILKNSVAIMASRFGLMVIGLLLTPYILGRIGTELFGLWALILAVVSCVSIADFGLGPSFIKFIAEYVARGEPRKVNGVLTTGLLFYGALGSIVLIVMWPLRGTLLRLVGVSDLYMSEARFVLAVGLVAWAVGNLVRVLRSIIDGLQSMEVSAAIILTVGLFYAVGTVTFLEAGWGVRGLAVNQLVATLIEGLLGLFFARRLLPGLGLEIRQVQEQFRHLLRFGLNLQVSQLAVIINAQLDKLLIGSLLTMGQVTSYDLASRVTNLARSFPAMVLHAVIPAASQLDAHGAIDDLYQLFWRSSKYVILLAIFLLVGVASTAGPLMHVWVGPGFGLAAQVTVVLAIGAVSNAIAGPVSPFVQGISRPEVQRNAELLNLGLNFGLSVALVSRFGVLGAAAGTAGALAISSVYYLVTFHRLLNRSLSQFLRAIVVKPAGCGALAGLVGHQVSSSFDGLVGEARGQALAAWGLAGAAFSATFLTLVILSRTLDHDDVSLVRRLLGSALERVRSG